MTGQVADCVWLVEVYGYMPERFTAATAAKARYLAFLMFRDGVTRLSFGDFIRRGVTVRELPPSEMV